MEGSHFRQKRLPFCCTFVVNALLKALHEIYQTPDIAKDRSIKGYIQVVQINFYSIVIILILSVIHVKSPVILLIALVAMATAFITKQTKKMSQSL